MKITMTASIEKRRARFIHKKQRKLWNIFMYKNPETFQKARQFPFRFYIQKAIHFTLRDFSWNFLSWHLYTKIMILCVMWRLYIQKARHFAKNKTICDTFLYIKIRHFASRNFSLNFWKLRRRGGMYFLKKQCTLCDIFILKNNALLFYVAINKEPDSMRYIFISKKNALFVTLMCYNLSCSTDT